MTALTTINNPTPFDGFEYDDGEAGGGANYAKFDSAAINHWHGREGAIKNLGPYYAANVFPELLKWGGKKVVDRILPEAGKPLPDEKKLNDAIDLRDWEEDFNGNPKGPWVRNFTVHLVDPKTGAKLAVSNSTVGMRMAYSELKERTKFMRRMRGGNVFPLVMLGEAQFRTSFGIKLRPNFDIVDWRELGTPSAGQIAAKPEEAPTDKAGGRPVTKPASAEIVMDEIPDHPCPENLPWDDPIPENL
jgi:hypothetical protein